MVGDIEAGRRTRQPLRLSRAPPQIKWPGVYSQGLLLWGSRFLALSGADLGQQPRTAVPSLDAEEWGGGALNSARMALMRLLETL